MNPPDLLPEAFDAASRRQKVQRHKASLLGRRDFPALLRVTAEEQAGDAIGELSFLRSKVVSEVVAISQGGQVRGPGRPARFGERF
jgi:hypothetical protein